jgi:hypothetical protein
MDWHDRELIMRAAQLARDYAESERNYGRIVVPRNIGHYIEDMMEYSTQNTVTKKKRAKREAQ